MKLVYFDGRGLAETSRILLSIANEQYEDFRYPINIIDWKTHQSENPEFENDKQNNKLLKSLNKLPYLEVSGNIIHQSKSIERFLAYNFNMMGDIPIESAQIDAICETIRDFKDAYQKVRRLPENEREAGLDDWFTVTLVDKLKLLENILGNDGFCVGVRLSLADVVLFTFLTQFFDNVESAKNAYNQVLKVNEIIDKVGNLPQVIDWINNRPDTAF